MNITVYDVLGTLFLQHIRWIVHRRSIPSLKVCEKYPLPDQHENHASYTSDRRRCLSVDAEDVFHRLMQTFPLQLSCIISLAIFKNSLFNLIHVPHEIRQCCHGTLWNSFHMKVKDRNIC